VFLCLYHNDGINIAMMMILVFFLCNNSFSPLMPETGKVQKITRMCSKEFPSASVDGAAAWFSFPPAKRTTKTWKQ
jgi:hypothetical protein